METDFQKLNNKITQTLTELVKTKKQVRDITIEKQDQAKELYLGIIGVIDTTENVDDDISKRYNSSEGDISIVVKRYQSIQRQLLNLLARHGVYKIDFPENRYRVGFSKIIETEPDSTKVNDTIISIIRNGYHRGSEIIREAELIVVKN